MSVGSWLEQSASVAGMHLRLLARQKALWWSATAAALLALPAIAANFGPAAPLAGAALNAVGDRYLSLLTYLLPLAFTAHTLGGELQSGTLAYTLARPLAPSAWVAGKAAGAALLIGACLVGGCTLAALADAMKGAEWAQLLRWWHWSVALLSLLVCVCCVCIAWSVMLPGASRLAAAAHLLLLDGLAGSVTGGWAANLSMRRAMQRWLSLPAAGDAWAASTAWWVPCLPLAYGVVFVVLAAMVWQRRDYRFAGH